MKTLLVPPVLAVALLAVACSTLNSEFVAGEGAGCSGVFGSYYLPTSVLPVTIDRSMAGRPAITVGEPEFVPDTVLGPACLNYLGSIASDDTIDVVRTPNQLLTSIRSKAVDRTLAMVTELGRTLDRAGEVNTPPEPIRFDPFDRVAAATVNADLARDGYCVFVEGASFPAGIDAAAYCDDPWRYRGENLTGELIRRSGANRQSAMSRGVLYRPLMPQMLAVYRRSATPRGPWSLFERRAILLPNLAPVLAIDVPRALFAQNDVTIDFSNGALTGIAIDRTSEASGLSSIFLELTEAVVKLPAQLIQLRFAYIKSENQLAKERLAGLALRKEQCRVLTGNDYCEKSAEGRTGNAAGEIGAAFTPTAATPADVGDRICSALAPVAAEQCRTCATETYAGQDFNSPEYVKAASACATRYGEGG
jgi:hypothetical protein